jgi:hypothetical protein
MKIKFNNERRIEDPAWLHGPVAHFRERYRFAGTLRKPLLILLRIGNKGNDPSSDTKEVDQEDGM